MFNHHTGKDVFLGLVILVLTIWWFSFSRVVIGIAGALLIIHGLCCRSCRMRDMPKENNETRRKRK